MTTNQAKSDALDWIRREHPRDYTLRVKTWTDGSGDALAQVAVNAKNGRAVHHYVISLDTGAVWRLTWDGKHRGAQLWRGTSDGRSRTVPVAPGDPPPTEVMLMTSSRASRSLPRSAAWRARCARRGSWTAWRR